MPDIAIQIDRVSKKFCRSVSASIRYAIGDLARGLIRRAPRESLRGEEFWALRDISASVARGECLGLIGPNGAGKSTLLKLIDDDFRPDRGQVRIAGNIKSLIRLGSGLQPLLTGRENIYVKCSELGLSKRETDTRLADIVAFTDLGEALDRPVKQYSDGMYARLEFSIATCIPMDILLIDEVLAVGDIAFQLRCLDRLNALKAQGTAIVFVSHSEMNMRAVADRCLLLFDGKALGLGPPDALLYKYYESVGYLNKRLKPLGMLPDPPEDCGGAAAITGLRAVGEAGATLRAVPGESAEWVLDYRMSQPPPTADLVLQFWNTAGILVGTIDTERLTSLRALRRDSGQLTVRIPFLPLGPGLYRVAGGFVSGGAFLGYRREIAELQVTQAAYSRYGGLAVIPAVVSHNEPPLNHQPAVKAASLSNQHSL